MDDIETQEKRSGLMKTIKTSMDQQLKRSVKQVKEKLISLVKAVVADEVARAKGAVNGVK